MTTALTRGRPELTELRRHWPAVLACFATAVFAWGFGFYGQSVFLAELQRTRGWSAGAISGASTLFYLAGALFLVRIHAVLERFGPRVVLAAGAVLLAVGVSAFARSTALWQLYAAALVMACGWAGSSGAAIATTLGRFFDRQLGLAISLALNGASAAGFTIAPILVLLTGRHGLARAVPETAGVALVLVLPLIFLGFPPPPTLNASEPAATHPAADPNPAPATNAQVLRVPRFWTVAVPFALVLMAQVGFIVHLVAFLLPKLGAAGTAQAVALVSFAAMGGRIALGLVIDRLDRRRVGAASFASQAVALGLMLAVPTPAMLLAGCFLFGLSVGNVITLPSLIVRREFATASFGLVVGLNTALVQLTFAFGPALLGLIRTMSGGYEPALGLCIALQLVASLVVLAGRRTPSQAAEPGRAHAQGRDCI